MRRVVPIAAQGAQLRSQQLSRSDHSVVMQEII
jgi:hypothetical protein